MDDPYEQEETRKLIKDANELSKQARDLRKQKYHSNQQERIRLEKEREFLLGSREQPIWPEGEHHLLSGPSGVGKSMFMLPAIYAWSRGEPVLGFPSHPLEFVYIMCEGSDLSLQARLNKLGLGKWDIRGFSIEQIARDFTIDLDEITLTQLPELFSWARVFFIEAINWFHKGKGSSSSKDYVDTLHLASRVRKAFGPKRTVIGTSHEAKMLDNHGYKNIRERPHGTVAQAASSGTIMSMQKGEQKGERLIHFAPREYPEFTARFQMGKGGILEFKDTKFLEITPEGEMVVDEEEKKKIKEEKSDSSAFVALDRKLRVVEEDSNVETSVLMIWGAKLDLSDSTVERWIRARRDDGTLEAVNKRGLWRKTRKQ